MSSNYKDLIKDNEPLLVVGKILDSLPEASNKITCVDNEDFVALLKAIYYNSVMELGMYNSSEEYFTKLYNFIKNFIQSIETITVHDNSESGYRGITRTTKDCVYEEGAPVKILIDLCSLKNKEFTYHEILDSYIHEFGHAFTNSLTSDRFNKTIGISTVNFPAPVGRLNFLVGCGNFTNDKGNCLLNTAAINESLTVIKTTISLLELDSAFEKENVTINDVLFGNYEECTEVKTAYQKMIGLIQIFLFSFNNLPDLDYQKYFNEGGSLTGKLESQDLPCNTLLYSHSRGYDYAMEEFDRYLEKPLAYLNCSLFLDKWWKVYNALQFEIRVNHGVNKEKIEELKAKEEELYPMVVKGVVPNLCRFWIKKANSFVSKGIWTEEERNKLESKFEGLLVSNLTDDVYRGIFGHDKEISAKKV